MNTPQPRRDFTVPLRVDITLPDGSVCHEYAVNISPGGLCLHVSHPLPAEAVLPVRLELPPEGLEVRALGFVAWTSWHEDDDEAERFWETGLQFQEINATMRERIHSWASQPKNRRR